MGSCHASCLFPFPLKEPAHWREVPRAPQFPAVNCHGAHQPWPLPGFVSIRTGLLARNDRQEGRLPAVRAEILLGDWSGEEAIVETKTRNPGKGEEEASADPVLQ